VRRRPNEIYSLNLASQESSLVANFSKDDARVSGGWDLMGVSGVGYGKYIYALWRADDGSLPLRRMRWPGDGRMYERANLSSIYWNIVGDFG
jgi:hypothetical protein